MAGGNAQDRRKFKRAVAKALETKQPISEKVPPDNPKSADSVGSGGAASFSVGSPTQNTQTFGFGRLLDFIEQPLVTLPLGTIGGIVGTLFYAPVLIVCWFCILLGFHRAKVVSGQRLRVQIPSFLLLAVVTGAGLYSLHIRVQSELQKANISIADLIVSKLLPWMKPASPPAAPSPTAPSKSSTPITASSPSPRDEGLKIADDITNFLQNRQKTLPSPETVEHMRETWTLFGQKFEGRLADELDKLGRRGLQDMDLKTEVQYLSSSTGNEDAILKIAKQIRTLALLCPPKDLYAQTSDSELANIALAEAAKIDTMTSETMRRLRTTGNTAEREFFAWHFKDCCLSQVEYLRAAMIERLGPVGIDDEEIKAFNDDREGITDVEQNLESELSSVLLYMPRFKAMAETLKAKAGLDQTKQP